MKTSKKDENLIKIFFNPGHYTVMENVGQFAVTVSREGDLSHSVCVDFKTEDGTAEAGSDYEAVEGTLIFRSGEGHKQVSEPSGRLKGQLCWQDTPPMLSSSSTGAHKRHRR